MKRHLYRIVTISPVSYFGSKNLFQFCKAAKRSNELENIATEYCFMKSCEKKLGHKINQCVQPAVQVCSDPSATCDVHLITEALRLAKSKRNCNKIQEEPKSEPVGVAEPNRLEIGPHPIYQTHVACRCSFVTCTNIHSPPMDETSFEVFTKLFSETM